MFAFDLFGIEPLNRQDKKRHKKDTFISPSSANVKKFSVEDAGRLLWGELRTHQLMEEFLYHKFMGHPKLAAYSIQHLFRNRLLPNSLDPVKKRVAKVEGDLSGVSTIVNRLNSRRT